MEDFNLYPETMGFTYPKNLQDEFEGILIKKDLYKHCSFDPLGNGLMRVTYVASDEFEEEYFGHVVMEFEQEFILKN